MGNKALSRRARAAQSVNPVEGGRRRVCQTALMFCAPANSFQCCRLPAIPVLVVLTALLVGGCSNALRWEDSAPAARSSSVPATGAGREVVDTATSMIGIPYRYGGETPKGFDCSGLVQYSYEAAGISVPRTSREQYQSSRPIGLADARPGDLLFFRYDQRISHVAIYLGEDRFVHAPSSGKRVSVASLRDPHYRQHFARAGRVR